MAAEKKKAVLLERSASRLHVENVLATWEEMCRA